MAGFFTEIFGDGGAVATALSGFWYLVGLFILIFFILYLVSRGSSAESIALFILTFLLLTLSSGLFDAPLIFIIVPIFMIITFASVYVYYWFNK